MEEIIFENEIAYKTKYDGYYVTKSGKVITTKVKGGQGRINIFQPREHCYKVDKDGYLEVYNVPLVKTQMKKIIVTAKTLYSHPKNVSKIYAALHTDLAW